jgi:hypothetical protein
MFHVRQAIALQQNDFAAAQDSERYSRNLLSQHLLRDETIDLNFCRAIVRPSLLTKAAGRDY